MNFVGAEIDDAVILRGGVARQHLSPFFLLCRKQLIFAKCSGYTIADAPDSILGDSRCHVPVLWVYDKVRVLVAKFVEVVVHLVSHN